MKGDLYDSGGNDEDGTTMDVQVVDDPDSVNISQILLPVSYEFLRNFSK